MEIGVFVILAIVGVAIFFGVPLIMSGGNMDNLKHMAMTNDDPANAHMVMRCNMNSFELNSRNNDKQYVEYLGKIYLMKDGSIVWKSSDKRNYNLKYTLDFDTESKKYNELGVVWFTVGTKEGDRIHLTFGAGDTLNQFFSNIREVYGS